MCRPRNIRGAHVPRHHFARRYCGLFQTEGRYRVDVRSAAADRSAGLSGESYARDVYPQNQRLNSAASAALTGQK